MESATKAAPLACVPGAIPAAERAAHFAVAAELFGEGVRKRVGLPDGYAFHFDPAAFEAVARFVGSERKCCPFLVFSLTVSPGGGPLWLRMTGPEGTRAFLDAELPG